MTSPIERASQMKRQSRGWSNDMESKAIARRLAIVEGLHSTWLALNKARRLPPPTNTSLTMPIDVAKKIAQRNV